MASSNYFNGVLNLKEIPPQNIVRILSMDSSMAIARTPQDVEVPLIYDEDEFTIEAKSTFSGIGNPEGNKLLTLLSGFTDGVIPSGQFALQNIQIWDSTDPLEFNITVHLEMNDSGYNDVVYPTYQLMNLCLPVLAQRGLSEKLGMLIPPGPSLDDILKLSWSDSQAIRDYKRESLENSLVNVLVGKFQFNSCIVTEVSPSFSTTVDENGYPTSANVSLNIRTCMVATRNMMENIFQISKGGNK